MSFAPPEQVAEYRVLRRIGHGAMGGVYLGHDTILDRPVAIKFILEPAPDEAARERFLREARAVARLQHENVVAVYRAGACGDQPYLVSEWVPGQTLDWLPLPLPPAEVLPIALMLSRGLAAAHRGGVLHRDVKPQNVMITPEGQVKLLDFGLAKLLCATPGSAAPPAAPTRLAAAPAPPGLGQPADPDATHDSPVPGPAAGPRLEQAGGLGAQHDGEAELTGAGALLGTPRYMAPELFRGEPASQRSDVYALGAVLYELCAGAPPHDGRTVAVLRAQVLGDDARPLRDRIAGDPRWIGSGPGPQLCAVIDRCLRRDPTTRYPSALEVAVALSAVSARGDGHGVAPLPEGNPYLGLRRFEAAQQSLFFGRDREARAVLELLRVEPVVLVTGDSGAGKSSLCRAGVMPWAARESLSERGPTEMLALQPGRYPLRALREALALPPRAGNDEDDNGTNDIEAALRARGAQGALLCFLDQAEELCTLSDPAEAEAAARLLDRALCAPGVRLLLSARGDLLGRLCRLPGLGRRLGRALYFLGPLDDEGLRDAITGPAQQAGLRLPDALVAALLSAGRADGALPLLQFALSELWAHRDAARGEIPASALAAIGGVEGALSRHADRVLREMPPQEQRAARALLLRLAIDQERGQGRGQERGQERRRELWQGRHEGSGTAEGTEREALEALVRGRLLVARVEEGIARYELAHEVLRTGWGALRRWLEQDGELQRARERLRDAAAEWERLGRPGEALFGARRLDETRRAVAAVPLGVIEREFLRASRAAQARRRLRIAALALGLPLLLAGGIAGPLLLQRRTLGRRVAVEVARGATLLAGARAQGQAVAAAQAAAFGRFDNGDAEEGERAWQAARGLAEREGLALRQAAQVAETALALDAGSAGARRLLAEALHAQALRAERDRLPELDALLGRLDGLGLGTGQDGSGPGGRLRAKAELHVQSAPPGARLRLRPYVARGGKLALGPPVAEGEAGGRIEAAPGSYLLEARLSDRPEVRLPLLLGRGERLRLRLPLPTRVPEGFVYVPAGRFLWGSDDDDDVRRSFFAAPPLHEARTGPYFIARHEVTVGEWLAFLRALPPAERAGRAPCCDQVRVALTGAGFALTLRPAERTYHAGPREPLRYAGRGRGAAQDWLRMPVSGVSYEDVSAYLQHLRERRGALSGVRLCDELEWERAARGADGRRFPAGAELSAEDANIDVTYGRRPEAFGPDEVGSHPAGRSPSQIDDAAGNVWEMVRGLRGGIQIRGGSYYQDALTARVVNREMVQPTHRDVRTGLRLCLPAEPGTEAAAQHGETTAGPGPGPREE